MDKTLAGLLGAMGALAAAGPAVAAPAMPHDLESAMTADSYADLLRPIPNAAALLRAASAQSPAPTAGEPEFDAPATVQTVQYDGQPVVDHHHHHHHRYYHHRRHHHRIVVPVPVPVPVPADHHHHHHHHNSSARLDHRFA